MNEDWIIGIIVLAVLVLIFGPGMVGAFDSACYFLTNAQCTSIQWKEWRVLWAVVPWAIVAVCFMFGDF